MITQKELKEVLDYDPETGVFTWKKTRGNRKKGYIAGYISNDGYSRTRIDRVGYLSHRLAWLFMYGYFPENDIDHINRNKFDNRIENLREVSRTCNLRNSKMSTNNSSGVKGVYYDKEKRKLRAQIVVHNKTINLGLYDTMSEAVCARLAAEQAENWAGCDSSSPAFQYVQKHIQKVK